VRQADDKDAWPSFNPSNYTFIGGTEGEDDFDGRVTASPDVFCGFGGNDYITDVDAGDVLLGGTGNDALQVNRGTVYGQEGDDYVVINIGTFYGGPGNDDLQVNTTTGIFVQD